MTLPEVVAFYKTAARTFVGTGGPSPVPSAAAPSPEMDARLVFVSPFTGPLLAVMAPP